MFYRLSATFVFSFLLLASSKLLAAATWLSTEELEYDIYDIVLKDGTVLFESADVYDHQNTYLLPFHAITKVLEINLHYGPDQGLISGIVGDQRINFDLTADADVLQWPVYYARLDDEIYIDEKTLAVLIHGAFNKNTRNLAIEISSKSEPFPIEKRIARAGRVANGKDENRRDNYDFIVEDQYRMYTPPKGHVSVTARANRDDSNIHTNIQTYSDLLYHSAHLTLAHNQDQQLNTRLSLKRSQSAPNKKIAGVFNNYAFGDVSASNTRLQTGYSGLGVTFSSYDDRFNNFFGKINIEEDAPANWQAELYKNGFLLQTSVVSSDGRVRFLDVDTSFGINRFEIRLYGPYGEEQTIEREFLVGDKMLRPGSFNFSGGILDTNKSVFENDNFGQSGASPAAFFQSEYGLNEKTSIGFSYFVQQNSETDDTDQEAVFSLSRQLPNALLDINAFAQDSDKYKLDVNILGSVNRWVRYNFGAFSNSNYEARNISSPLGSQQGYRGSVSARMGNWGINFSGASQEQEYELAGVDSRSQLDEFNLALRTRFRRFNFTNTVKYNYNSAVDDAAQLSNQMALSTPIGQHWYVRTSANFKVENVSGSSTELDSVDVNATWRHPSKIYSTFSAQYDTDDTYLINANVSLRKKKYNMIVGTSYSSENRWQINAGITFNLDYDYHSGRFNMQSEYSAATSTLDLLTFIDNNQNAAFDSFDEPLENVRFGIKPYWRDVRSNAKGLSYLPGVGQNAPVRVYFNTQETKSPNLRPVHDNFRVYSHAGGVIALEVPFNYATIIDGIVSDDSQGKVANFIPVQILNRDGKVVKEVLTDIENYFYFEGLWPGKYQLRIRPDYLASNQLEALPAALDFTLNGYDDVIEINQLRLMTAGSRDVKTAKRQKQIAENARPVAETFYSIQFGAYQDRDYCNLRVQELKDAGINDAFYRLDSQYCVVMAGQFKSFKQAQTRHQQIAQSIKDDAFIKRIETKTGGFAILLESYTTMQSCVAPVIPEIDAPTYVVNDQQRCLVYVGDFIERTLAQQVLQRLPNHLRKGAKVVQH